MVAVSIGGNDFNFASIVQTCVTDFLGSPTWWQGLLQRRRLGHAQLHRRQRRCRADAGSRPPTPTSAGDAQRRVRRPAWTLLVQNYPSPIPNGDGVPLLRERLLAPEHRRLRLLERRRRLGQRHRPADDQQHRRPARSRRPASPTPDPRPAAAFNGRRLCENTVGLYEEKGLTSWTQAGAVDKTEWVNQIRTVTTAAPSSPYYIQESLHPNYWAQLATRSCVRQAYNGGTPRGGTCSISGTGLVNGEPRMTLQ